LEVIMNASIVRRASALCGPALFVFLPAAMAQTYVEHKLRSTLKNKIRP
jgi:hypothetical protein